MGDRTSTLTFLAKDAASGAIKDINKHLGSMKSSAAGAGRALGGAAVTLGKIAATGAAVGLAALGAGLAYAAKQAAEEEKGIVRLNAAIKANTSSRKDETDAINAAIAAGEKKAYSDDDQRASITRLVTSTKDVNEALKLNALAMDFARLKGIPLADAANIIGKVHDGNVGILSRYGIAVAKGTTATEALAQIQSSAAGQADAYGKTTSGAWESVQLAVGNVVEDVGAALLPVLSQVATFLSTELVPQLQAAGAQFGQWVKDNKPLIDQIGLFVSETLTGLITFIVNEVIPKVAEVGGTFLAFAGTLIKDVGPSVKDIAGKLGDFIGLVVNKIIPAMLDFAKRVWEGGLNKAVKAAAVVVGSVIDILTKLVEWITGNEAIMTGLAVIADVIGAAFGLIADAVLVVMEWLGKFGKWITGNKALMRALSDLALGIGEAFRIAGGWVRDFFAGLKAVADWMDRNANVTAFIEGKHGASTITTTMGTTKKIPAKAEGGWVGLHGPEIIRVGEAGPEYITPNDRLRSGGSSGTPVVIPVVIDGREVARVVDEHLFYIYRSAARTGSGV